MSTPNAKLLFLCIISSFFFLSCNLIAQNPTDEPTPFIETREPITSTTTIDLNQEPSPTATAITQEEVRATDIPPSPTIDQNLPVWTILVYMAADNNLDAQAILNINQMEAAASSDQVNVIVQVDRASFADWSETRRYRIRPDDDPTAINSELLTELGELNMGDPNTFTDFIRWGMDAYPAQQYGLIMWNHGVGWSGIASDDTNGDDLSLNDLRGGLARGLEATPGRRFEMVGFDACLMGQIDVYDALVPYANFAVASEELTPIQGWAYTEWLNALVAQSDQAAPGSAPGGAEAATAAVDTFLAYYTDTIPKEFVTMAAIDLGKIPAVTEQFNRFLASTNEDQGLYLGRIDQARAGAETYARAYGLNADQYAALDLRHFARLVSENVQDEEVTAAS